FLYSLSADVTGNLFVDYGRPCNTSIVKFNSLGQVVKGFEPNESFGGEFEYVAVSDGTGSGGGKSFSRTYGSPCGPEGPPGEGLPRRERPAGAVRRLGELHQRGIPERHADRQLRGTGGRDRRPARQPLCRRKPSGAR